MTGKKQTLSDGKRIVRDEYGRFQSVELDSETARAMGKRAYKRQKENTSSTLLAEAGYRETDAPEHLRLLSQIASSKRSGAVPALRDFRRLTQPASETAATANMREVEPMFGNYNFVKIGMGGVLGISARLTGRQISELLREMQAIDVQSETSETAAS